MRFCCRSPSDACLGSGKLRERSWQNLEYRLSESCEVWMCPHWNINLAATVCVYTSSRAVSTIAKSSRIAPRNQYPLRTHLNAMSLADTEPMIRRLAEKVWSASRKESRVARTVVLKLKTGEFKILTRSHTPGSPPSSCEELTGIVLKLRERIDLGPQQRYRLVGVGLSNFRESEQAAAQPILFE